MTLVLVASPVLACLSSWFSRGEKPFTGFRVSLRPYHARQIDLEKPEHAVEGGHGGDTADNVFLHLALAKQVEFLVTGDADLLMKRSFAPVSILTLAEVKVKIGP